MDSRVFALCFVLGVVGCGSDRAPATSDPDAGEVQELVAFPGAEGFGKNAIGGRGGAVCHVTTLLDSGPGSLRDCVSQADRTIVFDVSGWITLESDLQVVARNLTIAGQTAPGAGVGVRGYKLSVHGRDQILRFLRARRGTLTMSARGDAVSVESTANDVIIDHCSVAFGTDENFSMPGDEVYGPRNLTVQWSIIAWGLQKDNHSAGSLLAANQTSIHHTLWAFNKTRNPRARSAQIVNPGDSPHLDWVNNVIYGWNARDPVGEAKGFSLSYHPFILGGSTEGFHYANAVGNYFIAARAAGQAFVEGTPNFNLFFQDNLLDGNENGTLDVSSSSLEMIGGEPTLLAERLPGGEVSTDDPLTAYERVLAGAGASVPRRDELDELVVTRVREQAGFLVQSEADLAAEGVGDDGYGLLPVESRPADFDSDADGMPSEWERSQGLDPADPEDRNDDLDGDGYTNLEEYLNALVPPWAFGL